MYFTYNLKAKLLLSLTEGKQKEMFYNKMKQKQLFCLQNVLTLHPRNYKV